MSYLLIREKAAPTEARVTFQSQANYFPSHCVGIYCYLCFSDLHISHVSLSFTFLPLLLCKLSIEHGIFFPGKTLKSTSKQFSRS